MDKKELEAMVEYCYTNGGCDTCPYEELCYELEASIPAGVMKTPAEWTDEDIDFILSIHK